MAGKNTSKSEHESRVGNIVAEYSLPETIKKVLEASLGSPIDDDKQYALEDLISNYRYISRLNAEVNSQDIKRTLTAMSKLSDAEALEAYENCDIHTEAHILRQIYLINKEGGIKSLKDAISKALIRENEINNIGGRPELPFIEKFTIECLNLWTEWTGKPITNSYYEDLNKPSATLAWCHILLEQVIGYGYNYTNLMKLISKNKR